MIASAVGVLLLGQESLAVRADRLASDFMKDHTVAGLTAAVVVEGKLVCNVAMGIAERKGSKPVTPDTLMRLGSVSKPITALAALLLVEQGKLTLDAPLNPRLPEWPKDRPAVTLKQLLTHTGGIRHYLGSADPTGLQFKAYTTSEAISLFAKDGQAAPPGSRQSYSTHAFTLVARAIETASGESFVRFLRKHVFGAPASVLDCEVLADDKPNRSGLFEASGKQLTPYPKREDNSWKYGGGGMEATARGLAMWADRVRSGKVLQDGTLDLMWSVQKLEVENKDGYGLGWRVEGDVVSHGGAQQGCRAFLMVDRKRKMTVAVLTNTSGAHQPGKLARDLAALVGSDKSSVR